MIKTTHLRAFAYGTKAFIARLRETPAARLRRLHHEEMLAFWGPAPVVKEPHWSLDDLPMRWRFVAGAVVALLLAYADHAIIHSLGVTGERAVWFYALTQFVTYFPIAAFCLLDTGGKRIDQAIESSSMYQMPFSLLMAQAAWGYMAYAPDSSGFGAVAMAITAGALVMANLLPQIERRSGWLVNVIVPLVVTVAMFWIKSVLFPFWP